jgi:autotransporter-associated beta strand protein
MGGYNQTMNGLSGYGAVDNTSGSSNYTLSVGGNNADSQFYGAIKNTSGIVSLNKIGTGTLIINGYENSYSGDTLISGGTIKLGATGIGLYEGSINTYLDLATANPRNAIQLTTVKANTAIGYNVTWVYSGYINNSGSSSATWTFAEHYLDAVSLLIDGVQVLYSTTSALTKGTYTLTPGLHGFELRLAGNSSGNNGVYSTGVHSTGLGVAYSTDGGTTYLALTDPGDGSLFHLSNSAGGSLPLSSAVVMASNTTLDLSDYSLTIGSLADADGTPAGHRVLLGSGTLTLGGNNKSTTFSGIISGTGSLIKTGSGTFTLAGANAYTGATMITSGTLKLVDGGSIAGGVIDVYAGVFDVSSLSGYSLSAGKTIKGNGSIIGSLTVLGTIAPGDSAGILNTADVTFGNGSLLSIELAGNAAGEFDVLNSSGTITLLSGSELILSLIGGYIPNRGDSFDILNFTSLSGEFTVTDLPTLSNGYYWDTDNLYTTGVITLVPEPAELIMLIAAFAALGIWSRIGKCRR